MDHHTTSDHHPPIPSPPPARIESAGPPERVVPSAAVDPADDHQTFLWRVQVLDLFGRERVLHAGLRGGHMVMIVPAGESATLTAGQARKLAGALLAGADQLDEEARAVARVVGRPAPATVHGPATMVPATSGGDDGFSTRAGRHVIGRQLPGYAVPQSATATAHDDHEDETDTD